MLFQNLNELKRPATLQLARPDLPGLCCVGRTVTARWQPNAASVRSFVFGDAPLRRTMA